jgi:hypothetical protein
MTMIFDFHPLCPRKTTNPPSRQRLRTSTSNVTKHHKILGMIFDDKLQWRKHVQHVEARAIKRLNLLKCLSRLRWGADQDVLLKIQQALILSVIKYEAATYGSARKRVLELHTGACRSTSIENLMCEAGSSTLDRLL